jgi:hypothetical protein
MKQSITITKDGTKQCPWTIRFPHRGYYQSNNWENYLEFKQALHRAANLRELVPEYKNLEIVVIEEDGVFLIDSDNTAVAAILKHT